ncbi:MAG TPA: hypothetical protein VL137_08735 [Polyangiaceae bacterium]|jgi:hypothetical protein|nr:hypothetical protein [Polyangiaceae bacterium]
MTKGEAANIKAFETPLPDQHDGSHAGRLEMEAQQLYAEFDDPADRLTVCELPRKSLRP